ncbi:MAG TPA: glutamate 5-kinase [bacterium]|nr:glutamate 5-kinase [bacterium]
MYKKIVVKIGTNLITDGKDFRRNFLKSITGQIAALRDEEKEVLLVSSGAIGAGIIRMELSKRVFSLSEKQAIAAVGQIVLMQEYKELFKALKVPVAQVLLDHDDVKNREKNANARNTLNKLIEWRVVPVINENDTVATEEIKFGDNDALAGIVGGLVNADLVVILSTVNGVYDKNPHDCADAVRIKRIENIDEALKNIEARGKSSFGTGGMVSKLETAKNLNQAGIPLVIADGNIKDVLLEAVAGREAGTIIAGGRAKVESKKRWILLTLKAKGTVKIDKGAEEAILEKGRSLLAVGISSVTGVFKFGDAVDITGSGGRKLAKGIVNYSSDVLSRIKGKKNTDIKEIMKEGFYEEVVHRDNLFVYR